jgi:WD40 repeat protein
MWTPTKSAVFDVDLALAAEDKSSAGGSLSRRVANVGNAPAVGGLGKQRLAFHAELTGHGGAVYAVQYSPDGKVLATASMDGTARLWDGE